MDLSAPRGADLFQSCLWINQEIWFYVSLLGLKFLLM